MTSLENILDSGAGLKVEVYGDPILSTSIIVSYDITYDITQLISDGLAFQGYYVISCINISYRMYTLYITLCITVGDNAFPQLQKEDVTSGITSCVCRV